MKMKTVLIVTGSIAVGLVIANAVTDGAVVEMGANALDSIKDKFSKGAEVVGDAAEVVTDVAQEVGSAAADVVDGVTI